MTVDVCVESTIARPVEVVSAYAADPTNAPEWYRRITSAGWQTEPPVRVGSRVTFVAGFLGRRLEYTYEVVEHDPGRTLVMRTSEGPFPMQTEYAWSSEGPTTTRMALRNVGRPSGFSRLLAPFVSVAMRRAMQQDLRTLKAILERG